MRSSLHRFIPAIAVATLVLVPACVRAAEGSFDKTLTVNGNVTLNVSTGSGYIRINPGSDNQVHIVGHVKAGGGWMSGSSKSAEERVNEVVKNPPIEQAGNIIRVGKEQHLNNVSIDYDITAPKDSNLSAGSGSGDLKIMNVGVNSKLGTGSGNIEATGLSGTTSLDT